MESSYACTVEVVHVGDMPRDDRVDALVAAAREAVVNAAKHAGGTVSVYVECTEHDVEVFVRDRGDLLVRVRVVLPALDEAGRTAATAFLDAIDQPDPRQGA